MDKKTVSELRKKAEEKLDRDLRFSGEFADKDPKHLIQELKTHQIELEMQNETLREAHLQLEKSQRKYAGLFQSAPVGYFLLDNKSMIREINAEGKRLLGLAKYDLTGTMFTTFVKGSENLRSFIVCRNAAVKNSAVQTCNVAMRRRNGADFHAELKIIGVDEPDKHSCLIAVSDISERKGAEQKKEMYVQELETLNDTVSRYLRAPVITLLGFINAIYEDHPDSFDDEVRSDLSRVLKHAKMLNRYVTELSEFTGISVRTMDKDIVEMKSVAKSVARDLTYSPSGNNGKIEIDLLPAACADMGMVRRAFECLFSNALKAVSVRDNPTIAVGGYQRDGEHVYYVRDNGIGFDAKYSMKLFLPFQKLHSETEFPGTGMGLAIVKKIVVRHEGRVWAEGKVGEGATFYFSLPARNPVECE